MDDESHKRMLIKEAEIFKVLQQSIKDTQYDQWRKSPRAKHLARSSSVSRKAGYVPQSYTRDTSAKREKLKTLKVKLSLRRQSLTGYIEREKDLIRRNIDLIEKIETTEMGAYRDIENMTSAYEKSLHGAGNMSQLLRHRMSENSNNLQNLRQQLASETIDLEYWMTDYDQCLDVQKRKLYELQCYKDKGYQAHALQISELETLVREIDMTYKYEYEELELMRAQDLRDVRDKLTCQTVSMHNDIVETAARTVHMSVPQIAAQNRHMQSEIKRYEDYDAILQKSISKLEDDITQLKGEIGELSSKILHSSPLRLPPVTTVAQQFISRCAKTNVPSSRPTQDNLQLDIPRVRDLPI